MKRRIFSRANLLILFLSVPFALAFCVMSYSAYQGVQNNNKLKSNIAKIASRNLVDKIDRNFYERFGDVQAFAYNRLAVQAVAQSASSPELQSFINTMTSYYVLYDLMMVCDKNGRVLAVNGIDKMGKDVKSSFIVGQNMAKEEWFIECMSEEGPKGGAWFSDYCVNNNVKALDNDNGIGWGMAFAAPIKDDAGKPIGVWYNFASWYEVTVKIRQQVEKELRVSDEGAIAILANQMGHIIEAGDSNLVVQSTPFDHTQEQLEWKGDKLDLSRYELARSMASGAYTYKGKSWIGVVMIPAERFTWTTLINGDLMGLYGIIFSFLLGAGVLAVRFSNRVTKNLNGLRMVVQNISQGDLTEITLDSQDEMGEMAKEINVLSRSLTEKVKFAEQIGKGDLKAAYVPSSEKDVLGLSLVNMRDSLAAAEDADKKRNWITEGLAKFGQLLRSNDDEQKLFDTLISHLVKYILANQGALFVINEDERGEKCLTMAACYAYDRKKYLHRTITIGEGLAGQAVRDKDFLFFTEIPEEYVSISSGLGDARPRCLLVMPLIMNEQVMGVVELASFQIFESHHIEFLKKVAENIASTISSTKVNERTKRLLDDSRQLTEAMQAQEEEMRQNMEELQATQEEMQRKTREMENARLEEKAYYEEEINRYKTLLEGNEG